MHEDTETALWAWFLFRSGLPTARAKALLEAWLARGLSLSEALTLPRAELDIPPQEAARLHPPAELPPVTALRWDNGYAPAHEIGQGLLSMPLKLRPALLFYRGEPALLGRPLLYLAAAPLEAVDRPLLHEALSLLVDEPLLLGAYGGSPQVPVLLEELAYSTGAALIFARTGLANYRPTELEASLLDQGRLVVVSPLQPQTAYQPGYDPILQQVAVAAARRVLLTGEAARVSGTVPGLDMATQGASPVLALTATEPRRPAVPGLQVTGTPADVLPWVDTLFADASVDPESYETREAESMASPASTPPYWVGPELTETVEEELGPPPSPGEILETLSRGGTVPEALRRRLENKPKSG
jgi:hypothetical protein